MQAESDYLDKVVPLLEVRTAVAEQLETYEQFVACSRTEQICLATNILIPTFH